MILRIKHNMIMNNCRAIRRSYDTINTSTYRGGRRGGFGKLTPRVTNTNY